jgi:hypothetical protein
MAQYRIKDEDRLQLQYNLIRSHSSGTGKPIEPQAVKAAILARLNTLSLGYSGVHPSLIHLMKELINRDITHSFLNMAVWALRAIWCSWRIWRWYSSEKAKCFTKANANPPRKFLK